MKKKTTNQALRGILSASESVPVRFVLLAKRTNTHCALEFSPVSDSYPNLFAFPSIRMSPSVSSLPAQAEAVA